MSLHTVTGNEVVQGSKPPLEEAFKDSEQIWKDSSDSSSSGDKDQINIITELEQNMSEIIHILSDLFKLSFKIRNPATRSSAQLVLKTLLYKEMIQIDDTTNADLLASYSNFDLGHVEETLQELRRSIKETEASPVSVNAISTGPSPPMPAG